jgi:hypothetical protein
MATVGAMAKTTFFFFDFRRVLFVAFSRVLEKIFILRYRVLNFYRNKEISSEDCVILCKKRMVFAVFIPMRQQASSCGGVILYLGLMEKVGGLKESKV